MIQEWEVSKLRPHPINSEIYEDKIDPDFKESIKTYGILEPLVITDNGVILSGARRWKVAKELGMTKVPCRVAKVPDEILALIEYNRYRIKTPREVYKEAKVLEERFKYLANLPSIEKSITRAKVAKSLGVSEGKLRQIRYIYEHENEAKDVVKQLDEDKMTVFSAYQAIKQQLEKKPIVSRLKPIVCQLENVFQTLLPAIRGMKNTKGECKSCQIQGPCRKIMEACKSLLNREEVGEG